MIRVLIVDDHTIMRDGLTALLAAYDDFEMVGQASNGREALVEFERCQPDVVVLDMLMPEMDGAQTTAALIRSHPDARILVLTSYKEDDLVAAAMKAGAMGYLLKSVSAEELADGIRRTFAGKRALSPEATDALIHAAQKERDNALPEPLTEREREVLGLMKAGLNNTRIAERLYLSVSTVKFHVSAILGKLGVASRTEAVATAIERKLI
jgi:two-component system, NarL family, response regulator LiaR